MKLIAVSFFGWLLMADPAGSWWTGAVTEGRPFSVVRIQRELSRKSPSWTTHYSAVIGSHLEPGTVYWGPNFDVFRRQYESIADPGDQLALYLGGPNGYTLAEYSAGRYRFSGSASLFELPNGAGTIIGVVPRNISPQRALVKVSDLPQSDAGCRLLNVVRRHPRSFGCEIPLRLQPRSGIGTHTSGVASQQHPVNAGAKLIVRKP